jgi:ABC-type phosphate/phosphonate transport system substrate-binding protein
MIALALTLVVCAPGYPGSKAEAQPTMDALAQALSKGSGIEVRAVYEETEAGGIERLKAKDAALLLSPLPFWYVHRAGLKLAARLMAVPQGGEALERWTLVGGRGSAGSLEGDAVLSTAGYAPRFVRAVAPALPRNVKIEQTATILSALRRAASGDKVVVLLDGAQGAGLQKLPFASQLQTLQTSAPVPNALLSTVGARLDAKRARALLQAFERLSKSEDGRAALAGAQLSGFVPVDAAALGALHP